MALSTFSIQPPILAPASAATPAASEASDPALHFASIPTQTLTQTPTQTSAQLPTPDAARRGIPAQRQYDAVLRACVLITQSETPLPLAELAREVALSPSHFHRVFRQIMGVTPHRYAAAHRAQQVRRALAAGTSVTSALYDAGFQSSSRFYAQAPGMLGMNASTYRDGGAATCIHFAVGQCSLGAVLVAQSERGICALLLGDDPATLLQDLQARFPRADLRGGELGFEKTVAQVIGFLDAPGSRLDLPLDIRGTLFQQQVWEALREIPAGTTVSYTEIARRIGAPAAVRAVASACGANALAVAIPCHRVVRSDGGLSGYRWGIERKRALLASEVNVDDAASNA